MSLPVIRIGFLLAGVYDFLIGMAFLLEGSAIFEWAGVPPPNHWAYIQFASLLLMVFGVLFFTVALDPIANRNLIPFGMLLKLSYCGLVGYYWLTTGCPTLFKPFAVIDGIMFFFFLFANLRRTEKPMTTPNP